jgi:hypothetical protein
MTAPNAPAAAADTDDPLLTNNEIAAILGVLPSVVRHYKWRGYLPPPDFEHGRVKLHRRSTILAWNASRPGPGNWKHRPGPAAAEADPPKSA